MIKEMNDEIKEILEYFQKDVDKYEESKRYLMQKYGYDEETIDNISQHERHINTKKILDYINTLEQAVKDTKDSADDMLYELKQELEEEKRIEEADLKTIQRLEEEIEELKSKLECYENDVYYSSKVDELEQENDNYKTRIEKAIEYIKLTPLYEVLYDDNGDYFNTTDVQATDDLLNILQNGSDNYD